MADPPLLPVPLAQDYFILGPLRSPGVCSAPRGLGSPRKWDVLASYGTTGETTKYGGTKVAHFEIDVSIWDAAGVVDWLAFQVLIQKPPPGVPAPAYGISHPLINNPPIQISSVVVEDVSSFKPDEYGLYTCTIKFIEFRRPLPAIVSAPAAAIPSDPGAVAPPATAAEREIVELSALRDELRGAHP